MSGELILRAGATTIALVMGDAVGAAVTVADILRSAVAERYPNAIERLQAAAAAEVVHVAEQEFPELVRRVERLEREIGRRPTFEEVRAILDGFAKAQTNALGDKRAIVRNALHNAFDPELYEQALSARLLAVLDELDYGDLHYLQRVAQPKANELLQPWDAARITEMDVFHADRLVEHRVLARKVMHPLDGGRSDVPAVTAFGRRMLELIKEPPPIDGESEAAPEDN